MTLYDSIGKSYGQTRSADPYIVEQLEKFLNPRSDGLYLDIGCGTGNYLEALSKKGFNLYGIDPSDLMLNAARCKETTSVFIKAKVENIPLENNFFDGAIAVLTLHHWENVTAGIIEVNRVLKTGSRFVLFSFSPEQLKGYWLCHYFPEMMRRCIELTHSLEETKNILLQNGFSTLTTENYFIKPDLQDHFLYSCKFKPEMYLIEEIRLNTSAFAAYSTPTEVEQGLIRLAEDIKSGEVNDIMNNYKNDLGDYLFLIATK